MRNHLIGKRRSRPFPRRLFNGLESAPQWGLRQDSATAPSITYEFGRFGNGSTFDCLHSVQWASSISGSDGKPIMVPTMIWPHVVQVDSISMRAPSWNKRRLNPDGSSSGNGLAMGKSFYWLDVR